MFRGLAESQQWFSCLSIFKSSTILSTFFLWQSSHHFTDFGSYSLRVSNNLSCFITVFLNLALSPWHSFSYLFLSLSPCCIFWIILSALLIMSSISLSAWQRSYDKEWHSVSLVLSFSLNEWFSFSTQFLIVWI